MTMTPEQIKQLEKDSESDAEYLALLLLLALRRRDTAVADRVKWNAETGQFIVGGRVVSFQTIRTYLSRIENKLGRRLLKITTDLAEGRITIDQWRREFEKTIGTAHVLAAALAVGGIRAAIANKAVLLQIDEQLGFAGKFAAEIKSGKAGSPAKIKARAKSYLRAAHIAFEDAKHGIVTTLGIYNEARRYMRAIESCKPCVRWARRGWIPIKEMPKIGAFPISGGGCAHYCKCYIVYRKGGAA